MSAKVSIIIPVYKTEATLPRCIDSALAQTYSNIEIVIVDDGSPDRAGEIADQYAAKHPNILVVHKKNGGLAEARKQLRVDSLPDKERRAYERYMESVRHMRSLFDTSHDDGYTEGHAEGRAAGLVEGRAEGRTEGIKEGRVEGRNEEREAGIRRLIEDNLEEKKTKEIIIQKLIRWFSMDEQTAQLYLDKYADSAEEMVFQMVLD